MVPSPRRKKGPLSDYRCQTIAPYCRSQTSGAAMLVGLYSRPFWLFTLRHPPTSPVSPPGGVTCIRIMLVDSTDGSA